MDGSSDSYMNRERETERETERDRDREIMCELVNGKGL